MRNLLGIVAGLVLCVALLLRTERAAPPEPITGPHPAALSAATTTRTGPVIASAAHIASAPSGKPAPSSVQVQRTPGLPASLQGSMPDGEVALAADGKLQPAAALRRLFDYFLSAIGEADMTAIRAMLLAHVRSLHGSGVAEQVAAVFDRYVEYQRALSVAEPGLSADLEERLAFAKALRRKFFDADTAQAFFGEEEAYAEYTLARRRVASDAQLDAPTRARRLRELEDTLPAQQRALLQDVGTALVAEEQSRQFDALQVGDTQRHEERSALFGQAAATRLAALDHQRALWDQRLAAYVQSRADVLGDARLSSQARAQRLADLRSQRFDENEARRVASLEAIGQL